MNFNINFGRHFNDYFQKIVKEHLGDGYTVVKAYYDCELRLIVADKQGMQQSFSLIDGQLKNHL